MSGRFVLTVFQFVVISQILLLGRQEHRILAQQAVCVTGVAMDILCINRGTLLDNSALATLEYPHEHSIHCLVDVPSCVSSGYEVLVPNDAMATSYVRAVALDEYGNDLVVQLARSVGQCSTCTGEGSQSKNFVVTVQGQLDSGVQEIGNTSDPPPLLRVTSMEVGDTACPTTPTTTASTTSSTTTTQEPPIDMALTAPSTTVTPSIQTTTTTASPPTIVETAPTAAPAVPTSITIFPTAQVPTRNVDGMDGGNGSTPPPAAPPTTSRNTIEPTPESSSQEEPLTSDAPSVVTAARVVAITALVTTILCMTITLVG